MSLQNPTALRPRQETEPLVERCKAPPMLHDQTIKLHPQEGQIADWQISMKVGFPSRGIGCQIPQWEPGLRRSTESQERRSAT
jgi:hypothetical protein